MNDDVYLKSLHAALSRATDQGEFEQLLAELDRFIANQVKRARWIPSRETR